MNAKSYQFTCLEWRIRRVKTDFLDDSNPDVDNYIGSLAFFCDSIVEEFCHGNLIEHEKAQLLAMIDEVEELLLRASLESKSK